MPGHSPAGLDPQAKWPFLSHHNCITNVTRNWLTHSARGLFLRNSNELPAAEKHLFAPSQPVSVLCIPMLAGGEPEGFLAVLSPRPRHQWHPVELKVLTALTTDVAFALMQQRSLRHQKANHQRLESLVGATEDMVFEFDEKGIILNVWGSHPALPAIEFRGKHIKKGPPIERSPIPSSDFPAH
ncbi:MAG: GAF domain-containing protein [Chitinivorax sp.]